jgi:hypothetical protein
MIRRSDETSRFFLRISRTNSGGLRKEHFFFQLVDPLFELVDLRPVGVDHRIDDPVEQRHRPLGHQLDVARTVIAQLADRAARSVVDRDQVGRSEKKIHVVGGETLIAQPEVDAVKNDVEITVVGLGFRKLPRAHRIFDGQWVE